MLISPCEMRVCSKQVMTLKSSPFTYLTLCERCQNKFLKSPIRIILGVHVFFITVWTASPKLTCFCLSRRSVAWLQVLLSIQKPLEGQFTGSMFAPHLVSVLRCHTLNGTTHYFYSCPHILRPNFYWLQFTNVNTPHQQMC